MHRRKFTQAAGGLLAGWLAAPAARAALPEADAARGVRTALERGAAAAIAQLGRTDGFLGNPAVRIGLPGPLDKAAKLLRTLGQGKRVDELVTAMNRAAEAAVPEARTLLVAAVRDMSVEDALTIVRGGDTAATDFFAGKTRAPLTTRFLPIVTRATEKVDLAGKYNALAARASGVGLLKPEEARLEQHVTDKALDGLYRVIGEEERRIRADPVGTGSALLKRIFGR